jgi:hypothetical protein
MVNLRSFHLIGPRIPAKLVTNLVNLDSITLESFRAPLRGLTVLTRLKSLNCAEHTRFNSYIKYFTNLRTLRDFQEVRIKDLPVSLRKLIPSTEETLGSISALTNLTSLDAHFVSPVGFSCLTNLTRLQLDANYKKVKGVTSNDLVNLTNLTKLYCSYIVIPDHVVAGLPLLKSLKRKKGAETTPGRFDIVEELNSFSESYSESDEDEVLDILNNDVDEADWSRDEFSGESSSEELSDLVDF